ncbi:MAG: pitrilysin family protein [Eubacteriales bacterium]|nr:pitrilysin family protein [Eubacteriales bacterium]
MVVIKHKIADGISLNIIETDKFKTNYIAVNLLTALDKKTAAYKALLPAVLKRGTVNYPDMAALNRRYDMLYSTHINTRCFKRGETHIFGFSAHMLDNRFVLDGTDIVSETLSLIAEIMFSPALSDGCFSSVYVESEKKNLIDLIKSKINNKNSYAVLRCQEEMCRGEVFAVSEDGTVEDVEAITPQSLFDFYKEIINRAQIEIYFVGKYDNNLLVEKVRNAFSPIRHVSGFVPYTEVIRNADTVREVSEEQPVTQGKLSLGFRSGAVLSDGDYEKFIMFSEIFGGSPSSKLFMNVREKLSLCYYCHAIPDAHKGIMIVASGIEVDKKEIAQDEILLQLENIRRGDFTEDEYEAAKKSIINGYRSITDSASGLVSWFLGRKLADIEISPEKAINLIEKVTKNDIVEAAKKVTLDTVYFMRGTLKESGENKNDD